MKYAIGDIHGQHQKLSRLLDTLRPGDGDLLVFLGDYIDYGPSSPEVIDCLLELGVESVFLMGNHEAMLLDFLGVHDPRAGRGDLYLEKGGEATIQSYGIGHEATILDLPASHQHFLNGLRLAHEVPGFLLVHGGLSQMGWRMGSGRAALACSSPSELLWDRSTPERTHDLGATVVYGHTVNATRSVSWNLPYSVGIDTGTAFGGPLTALCLDDLTVVQAT